MQNRQWQKLAEKKSRHSQKSHRMYWNIIVYPFNCLSWSILTQRDEKYGYSVIDSSWCVRVFFCLLHIYALLFLHLWHIFHLIFLLMTWWYWFWHIKMTSKVSQYIMAYRKILFCLWHIDVGLHTFIFLFMTYYKGPIFQAPRQVYILCHN